MKFVEFTDVDNNKICFIVSNITYFKEDGRYTKIFDAGSEYSSIVKSSYDEVKEAIVEALSD